KLRRALPRSMVRRLAMRSGPSWSDRELEANVADLEDVVGFHGCRSRDLAAVDIGAVMAAEVFDPERAVGIGDARVIGRDDAAINHHTAGGSASDRRDGLDVHPRVERNLRRARIDHYQVAHDLSRLSRNLGDGGGATQVTACDPDD